MQVGKRALIIGSGIAGLASALRLRKKGYDVDIYEANTYPGGKLSAMESGGYRWDAGPSLFTMPHFIDELFELYNLDPREHFDYIKKDVACHYFWEDGTVFKAAANTRKFAKSAAKTFGTDETIIRDYFRQAKQKYDLTAGIFLKKSLHKFSTYLSWSTISSLIQSYKLDISRTLNQVNEQYFQNPHLVQLFNRYATYNGSSPFQTPGIMSMIPHLELHYGTFLPKGGMHAITESLVSLALKQGISIHLDTPVTSINTHKGIANGIEVNGEIIYGDLVVSNMDIFSSYRSLLKNEEQPEHILKQERSSSALIFYWGIKKEFDSLDLHNILFTKDYDKEFDYIFNKGGVCEDPTIYINITSKDEASDAPEGSENWFVMINTPGNHGQDWDEIIEQTRAAVIKKINRILNTDIEELIEVEETLDPVKIEQRTSSHQGSLYGAASNNRFAAFLRHPNFSPRLKNLYFCGGSVHPGGGIPLCLLSAKIVSDLAPAP